MIRILISFSFLFTYFSGICQTQVFQDYDFASGDYALYFIDTDLDIMRFNLDKNTLAENYVSEHFYLYKTNELISVKESWNFKSVNHQYSCGSDYFGYVTYKDSIIAEMRINTECNEFILEGQAYSAPENFLTNKIKQFDTLTNKIFRCDNELECDSFILEMKKDENLVLSSIIKPQKYYDNILGDYFIKVTLYFKHEK